jgi:hypothetical protein
VRPLSSLPASEARRLEGLLFDLDDTLLSHGRLTRVAYDALWDLHDAGLKLVAVTGRPSGWGEVLARQWPVEGCVTENGAIAVVREGPGVTRIDPCDEAERRSRRVRLARLVERVRELVPEARLTDDVDARRSDVTWDVGERVRLPEDRIRPIVAAIGDAGARGSRSSVHLHATFDVDDKASGAIARRARRRGPVALGIRRRQRQRHGLLRRVPDDLRRGQRAGERRAHERAAALRGRRHDGRGLRRDRRGGAPQAVRGPGPC